MIIKIKDSKGIERFGLDEEMHKICLKNKRYIEEGNTCIVGLICGKRGSGKSLIAQRISLVMDSTIENNVDRICMNANEFIEQIKENEKKVIIADEGVSIFYKRNVTTREGKKAKEFFDKMRVKKNILLICIPQITDIDKDILLDSDSYNFVISVWEGTNKEGKETKGNYRLYINTKKMNQKYATRFCKYKLKLKGDLKFRRETKPPFTCQQKGQKTDLNVWHPVGLDAYVEKKKRDLQTYGEIEKPKEEPKVLYRSLKKQVMIDIIMKIKKENPKFSDKTISKLTGYSERRVFSLRNEGMNRNSEHKDILNGELGGL